LPEFCPKCGLLKDICACDILEKEEVSKIYVYTTNKKFKKLVTVVEGIDEGKIEQTAKELKQKLACGGTAKSGVIVLQGDHKRKMKGLLAAMGYPAENIAVSEKSRN